MTDQPKSTGDPISQRVYALIFNGITRASSSATDEADWIRLSERERIAEAVFAELRAGNIEFRLGALALLAEAIDAAPALDTVTPDDTAAIRAIADGPARDGVTAELEEDA